MTARSTYDRLGWACLLLQGACFFAAVPNFRAHCACLDVEELRVCTLLYCVHG